MGTGKVWFYYNNVTAEVIGDQHGITVEQLKGLTPYREPVRGNCRKSLCIFNVDMVL